MRRLIGYYQEEQPINISWGANKYHGLTTRTTWGLPSTQNYRGNHISTKCRTKPGRHLAYSKEHCMRRHRKGDKQHTRYSCARPTLEFPTCAWAPHTKTGIQTIERVQSCAARIVTGDYRRTSSVSDMYTNLMSKSLYTRRRIRDATMFLKIHHGLMHISLPVIITRADVRTRRQHKHKLRTLPTSSHSTYAVFHCGTHLPRKLSPHIPQTYSREPPSQSFRH